MPSMKSCVLRKNTVLTTASPPTCWPSTASPARSSSAAFTPSPIQFDQFTSALTDCAASVKRPKRRQNGGKRALPVAVARKLGNSQHPLGVQEGAARDGRHPGIIAPGSALGWLYGMAVAFGTNLY